MTEIVRPPLASAPWHDAQFTSYTFFPAAIESAVASTGFLIFAASASPPLEGCCCCAAPIAVKQRTAAPTTIPRGEKTHIAWSPVHLSRASELPCCSEASAPDPCDPCCSEAP